MFEFKLEMAISLGKITMVKPWKIFPKRDDKKIMKEPVILLKDWTVCSTSVDVTIRVKKVGVVVRVCVEIFRPK